MALREYKYREEELTQKTESVTYEAYQENDEHSQQIKELMFFINIAVFAIATVLAVFIFLTFNLNSIMSFVLALPTGLVALQLFRLGLKQHHKNKRKSTK